LIEKINLFSIRYKASYYHDEEVQRNWSASFYAKLDENGIFKGIFQELSFVIKIFTSLNELK